MAGENVSGVTTPLITNWLFVKYIKTNEINKAIVDGMQSPMYQSMLLTQKTRLEQGKDWTIPQWGGGKKSTGRDFQTVQSRNRAGATGIRRTFVHSMVPNFDEIDLERQTMLASKTDSGAFFATLKTDIDQSVMAMHTDITNGLYGGNDIGQLSRVASVVKTGVSGSATEKTVITLSDSAHALRFDAGMVVEFASAKYDNETDLRRKIAEIRVFKIIEIDHDKGTLTFRGKNTLPPEVATDDYIWREGDYREGSGSTVQLMGLQDYIPETIASNDSFLKTNRSVSPSRLAGYYYKPAAPTAAQDKGEVIYNAIVTAVVNVSKRFPQFKVSRIYANPEVLKELQLSKVFKNNIRWISDGSSEARRLGTIGFSAFKIISPKGDIPFVFDPHCPEKQVFGIDPMHWEVAYLSEDAGKVVNFKTENGQRVLLSRTSNSNVVFLESYHFLCGKLPGSSFRVNLSNVLT